MITIRELLKKINEVAPPIPGDEKAFVALHKVEPLDLAGHDSIHKDISPYGQFLKNVAAVKSPAERASHGYSKPGESEKAYSSANNEKINEAKDDVTAVEMKEAKKQPVGVEMHYKHATQKPFKVTHFSAQDAESGRKDYEKKGYKLVSKKLVMGEEAEQVDEISNRAKHRYMGSAAADLTSRSLDHGAMSGKKGYRGSDSSKDQGRRIMSRQMGIARVADTLVKKEEVEQVDELKKSTLASYAKKATNDVSYHSFMAGGMSSKNPQRLAQDKKAIKRQTGVIKAIDRLAKEEVEQVDENLPLLPKQKQIASDLLKKEMEARKKQRNDERQAGMPSYLPKMREAKSTEDSDTNDRMKLQAVLRPNAGMKGRLKGMVKQAQYNSDDY